MDGNEFDELIDSLPLHLRNKVLGHGRDPPTEPQGRKKRRVRKPSTIWFCIKVTIALCWALPWTVLGLVICVPIITAPFGIAVIIFGCYPAAAVIAWHIKRKAAYADFRNDV